MVPQGGCHVVLQGTVGVLDGTAGVPGTVTVGYHRFRYCGLPYGTSLGSVTIRALKCACVCLLVGSTPTHRNKRMSARTQRMRTLTRRQFRLFACYSSQVWVSNHGGRQLETSPPTIDVLPSIRAAVGDDVEARHTRMHVHTRMQCARARARTRPHAQPVADGLAARPGGVRVRWHTLV